MTSKVVRILVAVVFCLSLLALAQTTPASNAAPAVNAPSAATAPPVATGTKVGSINIELAVSACNEGQRDLGALSKKLEPKQTELKSLSDELDALKKQLNAQDGKLSEDARANLVKQIETKQKTFDRSVQDAREDAQSQQGEIMQRILQKMAPVIVKYATDNGFGMIIDTSQPWPQGPVVWYGQAVDITQPVVEAYNVKSGVPAPPPPPATGASRPAAGAAKPAASATKPPASNPPKQ